MVCDSSGNPSIHWNEFLTAYGPILILWTTAFVLLALPAFSLLSALFQAVFLLLWSYGVHLLTHNMPTHFPFNILNPHISVHHNHDIEMTRWLSLIIEAAENFKPFFLLEIIQRLLGIRLISTSAILTAAMLYINIHIFDYSIYGDPTHSLHHEKTFCNYGPEPFDTLFGTRCDPERPYTNLSNQWIHTVIACSIALNCKLLFALN